MSFFFKQFDEDTQTYPMMHQFLQNVKQCLKEGGHFIGTTIDGEQLFGLVLHEGVQIFFRQPWAICTNFFLGKIVLR